MSQIVRVLPALLALVLAVPAGVQAEEEPLRLATPTVTPAPSPEPEPEPEPEPQRPPDPPVIDATVAGDAVTGLLGGPHHTNAVTGTVGTPLGLAWKAEVRASQLLAVPGTVLAVGFGGLAAFDPASGTQRWAVSGQATSAAIVGDTVVAALGEALAAYALADGALRWSITKGASYGYGTAPVPAGDLVLTQFSEQNGSVLRALDAATGTVRWTHQAPNPGTPAVVGDRVYVPACGGGFSVLDRRDGRVISERQSGCSGGVSYIAAAVGRLVRIGSDTAFETDSFGTFPAVQWGAARPGLGILSTGEDLVDGVDPVTGRQHWRTKVSLGEYSRSFLAGDAAVLSSKDGLVVLNAGTGAEQWAARFNIRENNFDYYDSFVPAIAAFGSVFVVRGTTLLALRPGAPASPAEVTASSIPKVTVVQYGKSFTVEASVEQTPLITARDIIVAEKPSTSRQVRDRVVGRTSLQEPGFTVKLTPSITTDYTLTVSGATKDKRFSAVVIPAVTERIRRSGRDNNTVTSSVRLRVPKSISLGGRRYGLYVARAGRNRYQRLAVGTVTRTGRGRGRVTVRFRAPLLGGEDFFRFCVSGLSRRGLGFHDRLDRSCGRASVRF